MLVPKKIKAANIKNQIWNSESRTNVAMKVFACDILKMVLET